jgi:hypothetical protein
MVENNDPGEENEESTWDRKINKEEGSRRRGNS